MIIIILLLSTAYIDSSAQFIKHVTSVNAFTLFCGNCFLHASHKSFANLYKSRSHSAMAALAQNKRKEKKKATEHNSQPSHSVKNGWPFFFERRICFVCYSFLHYGPLYKLLHFHVLQNMISSATFFHSSTWSSKHPRYE